ncbi:MAG: hypothetical protein ACLP01_09245 [Solirubrobacteraceae bacterium]
MTDREYEMAMAACNAYLAAGGEPVEPEPMLAAIRAARSAEGAAVMAFYEIESELEQTGALE